jgi:hypothetical protein
MRLKVLCRYRQNNQNPTAVDVQMFVDVSKQKIPIDGKV